VVLGTLETDRKRKYLPRIAPKEGCRRLYDLIGLGGNDCADVKLFAVGSCPDVKQAGENEQSSSRVVSLIALSTLASPETTRLK
jgi:hypothetical protein